MFDRQGMAKRSDNYADFVASLNTSQCGSGAMPTLGLDGTIYPCFRWLGHTQLDGDEQSRPMCVGNVDDGFINKDGFKTVRAAKRGKISSAYCLECDCEGACAYCIGGCYAENHDFKRTEHICTIAKIRQKWSRRYWDRIEELSHNHDDYFEFIDNNAHDVIETNSIDVVNSIQRYDDEGNLKPGIEPTEEEIKFEKDMKYWFDKAARDTEVLAIARGQNDVVMNTLKTKSINGHTDEELEYQVHGN
jgi:radical SAM protein with 4Fe4S-binding SPASM domain